MIKSSIKFVNHASVIISNQSTSILSDPWFFGDAFHKGWDLLHETSNAEIDSVLEDITHIWISHEHPDHFSVPFFKTFADKIKRKSIQILFQETKDKRVCNFLRSLSLDVKELKENQKVEISDEFFVTCIKDGFYDSALLVQSGDESILNLNDCDVTAESRAKQLYKQTGEVDVLLTQFSYAAWKGGEANKAWREKAAKEKIRTIKLQQRIFSPKAIIPFASFIYFSNNQNKYLNDRANRPSDIIENLNMSSSKVIFLRPGDCFGGDESIENNNEALDFWEEKYASISKRKFHEYNSVSLDELRGSFDNYCQRIKSKNNVILMKIIRAISPIKVFQPVVLRLVDINIIVEFDYISKTMETSIKKPMLSMHSKSLDFIFKNSFGFDTLTVNGCFEEEASGGFVSATKTMAIENLNNLGVSVSPFSIMRLDLLKMFAVRLYRVAKKLN